MLPAAVRATLQTEVARRHWLPCGVLIVPLVAVHLQQQPDEFAVMRKSIYLQPLFDLLLLKRKRDYCHARTRPTSSSV